MSADPINKSADELLEKLRSKWDSKTPNWRVVELLAVMSENAYLSEKEASNAFHSLGFRRVCPVKAKVGEASMEGYVVSLMNAAVIVFRGTDEPWDWAVSFDHTWCYIPHGKIHRGFCNAYHSASQSENSLRSQVLTLLCERLPEHLWITGHSLGGALALVCAYDLEENRQTMKIELKGVLTFGQPMVVDMKLATRVNQLLSNRYTYFVNGRDIVPRLPPRYVPLLSDHYVHCGWGIWFRDGVVKFLQPEVTVAYGRSDERDAEDALLPLSEEEFEQLKDSLRREIGVFRGNVPWISDHSIREYIEQIRRFLQGRIL